MDDELVRRHIESARQALLREIREREGPDYDPASFAPGTIECEVALDRASMLTNIVEDYLLQHPAIYHNPDWFTLACKAHEALLGLFMQVNEAIWATREKGHEMT